MCSTLMTQGVGSCCIGLVSIANSTLHRLLVHTLIDRVSPLGPRNRIILLTLLY